MRATDLEASRPPFTTPAYRYLRASDKLPSSVAAYAEEDPLLLVKLFNPGGAGTWFIAGYDPETRLAFGVADIQEREVGDFDMAELVALRGRFGLPLERDLHWSPVPLSRVMEGWG